MRDKEFRSLNNIAKMPFYKDFGIETSADLGIVAYFVILLNVSYSDFVAWILLTIISLFLTKMLLDSVEQVHGQMDFVYFSVLISIVYTVSPEQVFTRGLLGSVYFLLMLFFTGVIKLPNRNSFRYKFDI